MIRFFMIFGCIAVATACNAEIPENTQEVNPEVANKPVPQSPSQRSQYQELARNLLFSQQGLPNLPEQLNSAIEVFQNHNGNFSYDVLDAIWLITACGQIADGKLQEVAEPYLPKVQQALLTESAMELMEERLGGFFSNDIGFYMSLAERLNDYSFLNQLFDATTSAKIKNDIAERVTWNLLPFVNGDATQRKAIAQRVKKYADYYLARYDKPAVLKNMSPRERLRVWQMRGARNHVEQMDIGHKLPDLNFATLEGQDARVSTYKGKWLLLDFWTTTCGPCHKAMPDKGKLVKELGGDAFQLISIACDEDAEDVNIYREEEYAMEWGVWHFPANTEHGESLAIRAYPTYILVSPEGEIVKKGNNFNAMGAEVRELVK